MRRPNPIVAGTLIGVLLAVLLIAIFRRKPTPIPERERRTIDSLAITKPPTNPGL